MLDFRYYTQNQNASKNIFIENRILYGMIQVFK